MINEAHCNCWSTPPKWSADHAPNADALSKAENLIERYGADISLPDLREEISQCERRGRMHDACMVNYVDLKPY